MTAYAARTSESPSLDGLPMAIGAVVWVVLIYVLWLYPIVNGVKAARRRGLSPHWMWFGIHPLGAWIAFAVLRWGPESPGKGKSMWTTYLLWLLFGFVGAHKFYLDEPQMGIIYLLTGGLFGVGWLIDLFTIPDHVRRYNEQAAEFAVDGVPSSGGRVAYELKRRKGLQRALAEAAEKGDSSWICNLIGQGADVNVAAGYWQETPLEKALRGGHMESAEVLLARGADVNLGKPLWYAAASGDVRTVEDLLARGADVNQHTDSGDTPLMAAAQIVRRSCARRVVEVLLENGADADIARKDGKTALWLAEEAGDHVMFSALRDRTTVNPTCAQCGSARVVSEKGVIGKAIAWVGGLAFGSLMAAALGAGGLVGEAIAASQAKTAASGKGRFLRCLSCGCKLKRKRRTREQPTTRKGAGSVDGR